MSPEEIAEDQSIAIDFVRATLMTKSQVFRSVMSAKEAKGEYITEDERREFYESYKALARYTDSDVVKEKALARLIDESRGRLDKVVVEQTQITNVINVVQIMLDRTKKAKEIALSPNPRPREIEVEEVSA